MNKKVLLKSKVLYFPNSTKTQRKEYYELYVLLKIKFDNINEIDVDKVNEYLESIDEKFYIKEQSYQLELYNPENQYIFCINKPVL